VDVEAGAVREAQERGVAEDMSSALQVTKSSVLTIKVAELGWPELCHLVLECDDVSTLQRWLDDMLATARRGDAPYRALRIHKRMNKVRRQQELAVIRSRYEARRA
jgi:hypothetical protein